MPFSQAMFNPLYLTTLGNHYGNKAIHMYSNFLHNLIPKCGKTGNVRMALKLQSFYLIHQRLNPLCYKYHHFLLKYVLESASLVILLNVMLNV